MTIDAEGTNLRQLTFNSSPNTPFPFWSPDCARLLYRQQSVTFIIDLNKSWEARTPEPSRSVAVSRDGRFLYYTLLSNESDVWLLNLE